MASYYLDTSALAKRYIAEAGSSWVNGLFDPALANHLQIAAITPVEMIAAVTRRVRVGTLDAPDATTAIARFRGAKHQP